MIFPQNRIEIAPTPRVSRVSFFRDFSFAAPELVLESDRIIESGMVLTLEPGVYGKPTGGIRLEHDYLVTDDGFERLSNHELGLA